MSCRRGATRMTTTPWVSNVSRIRRRGRTWACVEASHAVSTKSSRGVDLLVHGCPFPPRASCHPPKGTRGGGFMWYGGDRGWDGFGDRPDAQEGREDFKHRRRTRVGVFCGATEHAGSRSRLRSSHRLRLASHLSTVRTSSGASAPRVPRPRTCGIALFLHKLCTLLSPCASHPRLRPSTIVERGHARASCAHAFSSRGRLK